MSKSLCSVDGCERAAYTKGMCDMHYRRILHHGTLVPKRFQKNLTMKFLSRAILDGGCWEWGGNHNKAGYGSLTVNGTTDYAHRMAYRMFIGEIPPKMVIDHLCRNRGCCNPSHLEAVTQLTNISRGNLGVLKTHCKRGHPRSAENVNVDSKGHVKCRPCISYWNKIQRDKRKALLADGGVVL